MTFPPRAMSVALPLLLLLALSMGASPALAGGGRVHPSPESVEPLPPGASVPPVSVRTVTGDAVELAGLVRDRGALLVFYRGGW